MTKKNLKTLLLVEDDPMFAVVQKRKLNSQGYQVYTAGTGESAIALIKEMREIDLVLVDLDLGPGMRGETAAEEILRQRELPIIFLSAHTDTESLRRVRSIARYGYVSKDALDFTLLSSIEVALELFEAKQMSETKSAELERVNRQLQHFLWHDPESAAMQNALVSNIGDVIAVVDEEGVNRYKSPNVEREFGWKAEELVGTSTFENVHPEDRPAMEKLFRDLLREPEATARGECRYRHHDGSYRWISILATNKSMDPAIDGVLLSYRDDTERHEAMEEWLESFFREKELHLREIHHRIKNDLNFVASLLSFQADTTSEQELSTSLREACRRIGVMAQVYERLYRSGGVEGVEVSRLLEKLVSDLRSTWLPVDLRVDLYAEEMVVETRLSVSIGVIVNELLTNAAKYAFEVISDPSVAITLRKTKEGGVEILVRDNGKGLPEATIENSDTGFGLTIVNALLEQHSGTIDMWNDGGAVVRVRLPFLA